MLGYSDVKTMIDLEQDQFAKLATYNSKLQLAYDKKSKKRKTRKKKITTS